MNNQQLMIEKHIELLIAQSADRYYTEYLNKLLYRLRVQEITTEYAISEVNRTYQMYLERNRATVPTKPVIQPQQNQQFMPVMSQAVVQTAPERPKKNMEFTIGAGLLSVVGILFVLIAFVMLGITYMNGMLKGMCLYVIAVATIAASEFILAKKMLKFAVGITGLGICGLYLSTMLNYLYLKNFNGMVAVIIAIGISLIAILISRKKDSGIIKIISFIGCYMCIFPVGEPFMGIEAWDGKAIIPLLITTAILLIVNLMTLMLPVKKNATLVHIVHMIANTVFSFAFMIAVFDRMFYAGSISFVLYFLVLSVLVQGLIFYAMDRKYLNNISEIRSGAECAGQIVYIVTNIFLLCMIIFTGCFEVLHKQYHLHLTVGSVVLVYALLFVLFRKHSKKWIQYWLGSSFVLCMYLIGSLPVMLDTLSEDKNISWLWWRVGSTIAVFFVAKLLSGVKKLQISELLITLYTAILGIQTFCQLDVAWNKNVVEQNMLLFTFVASIIFLCAFLLSLMALKYFKSVYEQIVLVVFMLFIIINFRNDFTPALLMGILFVATVGFNSIDFTRGKNIKVCNYINLGWIVFLYIAIAFIKNPLLYVVMLLLGISYIVLTFRNRYGMDFKIKNLILVLFLCYMTLIWDMPLPIMKSIIIMLIAIGAVAVGFAIREKGLRITGLVLTLIVCAKIVVYDFAELENAEKMILFLVTGLIALAISGIYIALEKKIV